MLCHAALQNLSYLAKLLSSEVSVEAGNQDHLAVSVSSFDAEVPQICEKLSLVDGNHLKQ